MQRRIKSTSKNSAFSQECFFLSFSLFFSCLKKGNKNEAFVEPHPFISIWASVCAICRSCIELKKGGGLDNWRGLTMVREGRFHKIKVDNNKNKRGEKKEREREIMCKNGRCVKKKESFTTYDQGPASNIGFPLFLFFFLFSFFFFPISIHRQFIMKKRNRKREGKKRNQGDWIYPPTPAPAPPPPLGPSQTTSITLWPSSSSRTYHW